MVAEPLPCARAATDESRNPASMAPNAATDLFMGINLHKIREASRHALRNASNLSVGQWWIASGA
jgi:hypothetical protein